VCIALVHTVVSSAAQYVGESVGWKATNALRADLALHVLELDLGFHKTRTTGELIERIDGDVSSLANFFSRFVVSVIGNLALLLGVVIVVLAEDAVAGIVLGAYALIALLVLGRLRSIAVGRWRRVREVAALLFGFIGERLAGTEDIRSCGAEVHVMNGLALQHRAVYAARKHAIAAVAVIGSTTTFTFALGSALSFGVGGYLWSAGAITLGTVYLLFHYTELLRRPIEQLRVELEEVQRALGSIGRIDELLRTESRLPPGRGLALPDGALAVDVDDVTFAYEPDGESVLRGVTLRLAPGRVLGVLGRTGSGKTTIARLLLRFYDPTSGTVSLGGVDVREADLSDVRRRATLVTQDVQLFHASVRDNLTFFDPAIDDARILEVLERVGLGGWLRRLSGPGAEGDLDSLMTAGELSAGEAQLLAFVRAFLRDPGLVILDEASSRLDPATERHIERAIDALLADRTGVVIAHRLATLQRCDEIAILEGGQVVERGDRLALAGDPSSRFAQLLSSGLEQVLA